MLFASSVAQNAGEEHALTRPIKSRAVSGLNIDAVPRKIHGNICSPPIYFARQVTLFFSILSEGNGNIGRNQKLNNSIL